MVSACRLPCSLCCVGQASDLGPLLCCLQGQGALSERLRSFSMQDLTTIRGDGAPAPSSTPTPGSGRATGKHGQPKMSRSASESASSSGRCHFPLPPFQFISFAFVASGPVLIMWHITRHCRPHKCPSDHSRPAERQSTTRASMGG